MTAVPARRLRKNAPASPVESVRSFNRFYTRQIGVLQEGLLRSQFSLTEVRVMYELLHRRTTTAQELVKELNLDAGYLSRLLESFARRRLLRRQASRSDRRQVLLSLTRKGRLTFAPLDKRASAEVAAMLARLSPARQQQLLAAMNAIEQSLTPAAGQPSYLLRSHRPGDVGWMVQRHGQIYAQEYRWDEQFEGLVADIGGRFLKRHDPKREHCWIAERNGENLGCVLLVQRSRTVAQLRLLLVEPSARGMGIGKRLVEECIRFARQAGYRKLVLWTNHVLLAARHLYRQAGFHIVATEKHHSYGHSLVAETWELKL